MAGHWGKSLRINLRNESTEFEDITEDFMKKFIGGSGFAAKILYDDVNEDVDPLDPENEIIISPGLLVGTGMPRTSKTTFGFKSPLTGGYGKAVVGADLGVDLKKSGFDNLIIEGKSDSPVIVIIEDGEVKIKDAEELWGLNTKETMDKLKDEYNDHSTAVIGPAGEKLSSISIIECDERQAARGGPGAVMGSKNLKAIIIKGTKDYPAFDMEKVRELTSEYAPETRDKSQSYINFGTGGHLNSMNTELGAFPVRNFQSNYFRKAYDNLESLEEERIDIDPKKWVEEYQNGVRPCPYCPAPCSTYFEAKDTPYGDIGIDGPEYETQYSFGGACEVNDIEAVAKANELCDKLGIDTISAGVTIAWAMEAYERGLLDSNLDLNFGNAEAMIEAVEKMGNKDGELGKLLFNGVKQASKKLGKGSEEFAIHVKGMEPAGYEPRGMFGMGLAFSVAPRGADHLTSSEYVLEFGGSFWYFNDYDRYDIVSKAFPLKMLEDLMMVYDMTGICKFSRGVYADKKVVDLVNAATGWSISVGDLLTAGERGHNVAKAYNVREGFGREKDKLPNRFFSEEAREGPSQGKKISKKEFEQALDRYYDVRGYNNEGKPFKGKLENLDLPEIANKIGSSGPSS